MLASPLLVGALAAGLAWRHVVLAAFWFAGYFAFFAVTLWLKSGRRPRDAAPMRAYLALAAVLGVATVATEPSLVRWAPLFAVPLGLGLWSSAHRHERSLLSGLSTTVGSALMTVVAYDAGAGSDWSRAWTLTALQAAYFAGTVFYVKSLIRERANAQFLTTSIGYHVAVALAGVAALLARHASEHGLSWWVVSVFALLAVRAAVVPRFSPTPRQIGVGEIAATTAVAVTSLLA
jgi:hypothetical protein